MTNFFRVHCVLSCGTMALRVEGIRQRSLLVYFLCIKGSMWKGTLFSSFCMCGSRSTTARANPGVYVLEGRKGNFQENTVGIGLIIRKSKEEKKTMLIYKKWVSGFPSMPLCHNNVAFPHDLCSGGWWLIFFSAWSLSGIQDQALKCVWNWTRPLYASGFWIRGASSRNTHGEPHNVG